MVNVVVFDKFLLLIWVAASAAAFVVAVAVSVVVVDDIAVRLILAFLMGKTNEIKFDYNGNHKTGILFAFFAIQRCLKELDIHKQFPEV